MPDLETFQNILGVTFKEPSYLRQALTHSSYINENPAFVSNERLEFLGDAVLGLVIAERLYADKESATEGELTRLRATLVSREGLVRVARSINLGAHLYLGKGEELRGGRLKPANLAGALEAVIAAIFLDQGLGVARSLILGLFEAEIQRVMKEKKVVDCKSELQEITQSRYQCTPVYRLVSESGPSHDRVFTVEVVIGDSVVGRGSGKNKKEAETEAAREALERLLKGKY